MMSRNFQRWQDQRVELLEGCLEEIEDQLVQLSDCLQKERMYATTFNRAKLQEITHRKEALLASFRKQARARRERFLGAWMAVGKNPEMMPRRLPELLRQLAETVPGDFFEDAASRIEALVDVVRELQEVNGMVVQQVLSSSNAPGPSSAKDDSTSGAFAVV